MSEEILSEDILSESEIAARYPDEWVLVEVVEYDAALRITCGKVRAHGTNQQEIEGKAVELDLPQIAFLFTGKTENLAFLL